MKVTTNNVPRPLVDACDLTAEERATHDYLDWDALDNGTDSATFIRYRGDTHYIGNFTEISGGPLADLGWQGVENDSAFSGTVIRPVDDEMVIMGWFYS